MPLAVAVHATALSAAVQRSRGQIVVAAGALPEPPAAVEAAAYRIGVEAMTNAVRHARPSRVCVTLSVGDAPAAGAPEIDALEIAVRDDGAAGPAWTPGCGLTSIGERTAELGGQWRAGPAPDGGGLVWARLPVVAGG